MSGDMEGYGYYPALALGLAGLVTHAFITYAMADERLGGLADATSLVFFYHPALMSAAFVAAPAFGRAVYLTPLPPRTARFWHLCLGVAAVLLALGGLAAIWVAHA